MALAKQPDNGLNGIFLNVRCNPNFKMNIEVIQVIVGMYETIPLLKILDFLLKSGTFQGDANV